MLTGEQIGFFEENGYLVVEDVFDQKDILDPVRTEYADLLDELYGGWFAAGRVETPPEGLSFHDKMLIAYKAKCDWFQPMDCSLPGDTIYTDTPMHFGPAIFNLITAERMLDLVEDLIGPEITSNPIQHIRIKPPATDLSGDEIRAHITATDWHQDRAVALAEASGYRRIYGIGGAGIYKEMLGIADRLLITEVDVEVEGADTWFPTVDVKDWRVLGESVLRESGPQCRVVEMVRN